MNKYFAKKTNCAAGHLHDSKREAARCNELHLLERSGEISGLSVQPKFKFAIDGSYVMMRNGQAASFTPDFQYKEAERIVVEDVKSDFTMTEAFRLRAALFRHLFPDLELRITK